MTGTIHQGSVSVNDVRAIFFILLLEPTTLLFLFYDLFFSFLAFMYLHPSKYLLDLLPREPALYSCCAVEIYSPETLKIIE